MAFSSFSLPKKLPYPKQHVGPIPIQFINSRAHYRMNEHPVHCWSPIQSSLVKFTILPIPSVPPKLSCPKKACLRCALWLSWDGRRKIPSTRAKNSISTFSKFMSTKRFMHTTHNLHHICFYVKICLLKRLSSTHESLSQAAKILEQNEGRCALLSNHVFFITKP